MQDYENVYRECISLNAMRDAGIARFGVFGHNHEIIYSYHRFACHAEVQTWAVGHTGYNWKGDGPIPFKGFIDPKVKGFFTAWQGRTTNPNEAPRYGNYPKCTYDELSLRWLQFILDPHVSPWRALLPYLVDADPVVVQEKQGFIFIDLDKIPFDLWYNFLIATRVPWEKGQHFARWLDFQDKHGCTEREAYVLASNWTLPANDGRCRMLMFDGHYPLGYFTGAVRRIVHTEPDLTDITTATTFKSRKSQDPGNATWGGGRAKMWDVFCDWNDHKDEATFHAHFPKFEHLLEYVRGFMDPERRQKAFLSCQNRPEKEQKEPAKPKRVRKEIQLEVKAA